MTRRVTSAQRDVARARREQLRTMSEQVKVMMMTGRLQCGTINEGLKMIYERQGHTDLKTFHEWKDDGYCINEGARSCMIWSRKVGAAKSDVDNVAGALTDEKLANERKENSFSGFGVCHLYGRDQVHLREQVSND